MRRGFAEIQPSSFITLFLTRYEDRLMTMIVSSDDRIEGARSLTMLGRIRAATGWHAAGRSRLRDGEWKEAALQQLIRRAEDIDADAIIGLDYVIDGVTDPDDTGMKLQRIAATGLAVRIGRV
jgi:uncharacterized protein YbjQ (UPF0145 family)